ncbi:MAG: GtrA family protein [Bacteroidales bacterium]|jgi:putative flippase GtrA|nr:GtrA family protein [Bacteroidales bacterium]MBR6858580.1 GtrA family protein [Bacteroidales bacterium]MBR6863317.1 GtrA family protein [Bacteroidales bacterium]
MKKERRKRLSELLVRFAIFSITSGAGTLVDLGVHWWLSAAFHPDSYLWRFWIAPLISFELAVLTNFLIAYYFVWRERISQRTTRSFFRHYAGYNATATGVFFVKLLIMQGFHLLLVTVGWLQDKTYEPALCNLLAMCLSGLLSFALNEFVVFRKIRKED